MQTKTKNIFVSILFCLFIIGGALFCVLKPADSHSVSERRELKQFPKVTWKAVLSTTWMKDFETYTLDQFPLRDKFRELKAFTHYYAFSQKDNNNIYLVGDHVSKLEAPLKEEEVSYAASRFEAMYHKFFAGTDAKMYYSIIPDKNYFLAEANGYPALDYEKMLEILHGSLTNFTYIDIFDQLSIDNYYRTDTHWKQETLGGVVEKLSEGLGVRENLDDSYTVHTHTPFYGVYAGQAALPVKPDTLTYLESELFASCTVTNYETGSTIPMYVTEKLTSDDPYEAYLGGPLSLVTIENPNAQTDRELVIFRDSFGSSVTPLLVSAYAKITLVDIRYIMPDFIRAFVNLSTADDVLFLYSTLVLNNASTLH